MWIRLQLYENDLDSMLGVVISEIGECYYRATDVIRLMGWNKDPWSKLKKLLPTNRPVESVVPRDVPMSYGSMRVVTLQEMVDAIQRLAQNSPSLFLRTRNANVLCHIVRLFNRGRIDKNQSDPFYTTNPMKAHIVKIVLDGDDDMESYESFIDRTKHRFMQMYQRLAPVQRQTEIPKLSIDAKQPADFKIHCNSRPPSSIAWCDGNKTYIFRCMQYIQTEVGGEKMTLSRNAEEGGQAVKIEMDTS